MNHVPAVVEKNISNVAEDKLPTKKSGTWLYNVATYREQFPIPAVVEKNTSNVAEDKSPTKNQGHGLHRIKDE